MGPGALVSYSLLGASSTIKVAAPAVIQHNYLIFSYFYDRLTELGMVRSAVRQACAL